MIGYILLILLGLVFIIVLPKSTGFIKFIRGIVGVFASMKAPGLTPLYTQEERNQFTRTVLKIFGVFMIIGGIIFMILDLIGT